MHTTASLTSTRTVRTSATLSWVNARTAASIPRPKSPAPTLLQGNPGSQGRGQEERGPLQIGYTDTESELKPVWYVDVDSPETEVFEIKLTPYGRKIRDLTGPHGVEFDTEVIECY